MRRSLILLFQLTACGRTLTSENDQLGFDVHDLATDLAGGISNGGPVLAGTRICAELLCGTGCTDRSRVLTCFEPRADGAATLSAEGCLQTTAPGAAIWAFDAVPCEANAAGYTPVDDRVTFAAVPAHEVTADLQHWPEEAVAAGWAEDPRVLDGDVPTDWLPAPGEPLRVAEGGSLTLPVRLTHPGHADPVGYNPSAASVGGAATLSDDLPGFLEIEGSPAASSDLSLTIGADTWSLGALEVVPTDEIVSLEVLFARGAGDAGTSPLGARAVARDAEGHPVFGLPVAWSLAQGTFAIEPHSNLPGPDYAWVRDTCIPPSKVHGKRSGVLVATFGDLVGRTDIRWEVDGELSDDGWTEDPFCTSGCGCATSGFHGGWAAWLVWVGWRRRRGTSGVPRSGHPALKQV